jgi:hypothetical protein
VAREPNSVRRTVLMLNSMCRYLEILIFLVSRGDILQLDEIKTGKYLLHYSIFK